MNWDRIFARRAPEIHAIPKVDPALMRKTEDLVYFGGGAPPAERIPVERLRQAMLDTWEDAAAISGYDETCGHLPLRQLICERMAARGVTVDVGEVLITNGAQQGLDLVSRALLDPGDRVIVEGPTYFGALQVFDMYEVEYLIVPVDAEGIVPDALEKLLRTCDGVKAIYTVSIFQNPTGVTISRERRRRILELAREANVAIIEDDPYGELAFGDETVFPLRAGDANVIYLGTFSKTIMPALRIGWAICPAALRQALEDGKEAVDIQSDRFVQRMITSAARDGWLDAHVAGSRAVYRERAEALHRALEREMPDGAAWVRPGGGFFLWLTLPEYLNADDLLPVAAASGVSFMPGSFFYPDRRGDPGLRIGFTGHDPERIDAGISRLARAIDRLTASR